MCVFAPRPCECERSCPKGLLRSSAGIFVLAISLRNSPTSTRAMPRVLSRQSAGILTLPPRRLWLSVITTLNARYHFTKDSGFGFFHVGRKQGKPRYDAGTLGGGAFCHYCSPY